MSNYSKYAKQFAAKAISALDEYKNAKNALDEAQKNKKKLPVAVSPDPAIALEQAQAEMNIASARARLNAATNALGVTRREFLDVRGELMDAVTADYSANPADVDSNTLELLKSGIMRSNEYARLLDKAVKDGNVTMARLIGKYAEDAAVQRENNRLYGHDSEAMALRSVSTSSSAYNGNEYIDSFDVLVDIFDRCSANVYMIDQFEELAMPIVKSF